MAIKHVNKKRIELTRQVLLELKHVSVHWMLDDRFFFFILLQGWVDYFVLIKWDLLYLYNQKSQMCLRALQSVQQDSIHSPVICNFVLYIEHFVKKH